MIVDDLMETKRTSNLVPMKKLEPGEAGTLTIQWRDKDGKWIPRKGYHRTGTFRARVRVCLLNGEYQWVRLNASTPAEAEERALAKVKELLTPTHHTSAVNSSMTFAEALEAFLKHLPTTKRAKGTVKLYTGTLKRHTEDSTLSPLKLSRANDAGILRDFLYGIDKEHGHGVARTLRSALTIFFDYAVTRRAITFNEMRNVESWKVSADERTTPERKAPERDHSAALTPDEKKELLIYADKWKAEPTDSRKFATRTATVDLLHFLLGTGARISEALALNWADVDLEAKTIHIRDGKTVNAIRTIALPDALVKRLTPRHETDPLGYVFPAPTKTDAQWNYQNCRRSAQELLEAAGFPWATIHTLRTTVATLLLDAGVPLRKVADLLGHSTPTVTLTSYAGRSKNADAAVAKVLGTL